MKLSEIARYWAAKGLTRIAQDGKTIVLGAPFATPDFTLRIAAPEGSVPLVTHAGKRWPLERVDEPGALKSGTWLREDQRMIVCFDLAKGQTQITL
jgi:hypothetical protein